MAYQNYSDQPAQYGQQNPYGNPSPYGQAGNPYDDNSYQGGGNPYAQGQYDRQGYEMNNMNGSDPNRILNQCREIDSSVDALEQRQEQIQQMQRRYLGATDFESQKNLNDQINRMSDELINEYRQLVRLTKNVKQDKESGSPRNAAQVGKVDRRVKASMNKLQQLDSSYRKQLQDRMARDYRIVRPDASDAEVREATEDPNQQIFSQALINSDRRGEAQSVATNVRNRHQAIRKIEEDMIKLAELFQDLDALVVQQEAQVTRIEERGEEVKHDVTQANVELDGAVTKARAARKKKWICLGIAVLIVIIIVVVVVVCVELLKK